MAGNENMIKAWPLPTTDEADAEFWAGPRRGEVMIQVCGGCGAFLFPSRNMCPTCYSTNLAWRKTSGSGRVWSFTVPHPPLLPVFNDLAPYNVVVVELDDAPGIRLVGNLVESADGPINGVDPAGIRIGDKVKAVFVPMADDVSLVRWVRA